MTILTILGGLFSLWKACHPNDTPTPKMIRDKLATKWRERKQSYAPAFLARVKHDLDEAALHRVGAMQDVDENDELAVLMLRSVQTGTDEDLTEALAQIA